MKVIHEFFRKRNHIHPHSIIPIYKKSTWLSSSKHSSMSCHFTKLHIFITEWTCTRQPPIFNWSKALSWKFIIVCFFTSLLAFSPLNCLPYCFASIFVSTLFLLSSPQRKNLFDLRDSRIILNVVVLYTFFNLRFSNLKCY